MRKVIAALFMLCLVTVVVPPVQDGDDNDDYGISTHEYSSQRHVN